MIHDHLFLTKSNGDMYAIRASRRRWCHGQQYGYWLDKCVIRSILPGNSFALATLLELKNVMSIQFQLKFYARKFRRWRADINCGWQFPQRHLHLSPPISRSAGRPRFKYGRGSAS